MPKKPGDVMKLLTRSRFHGTRYQRTCQKTSGVRCWFDSNGI